MIAVWTVFFTLGFLMKFETKAEKPDISQPLENKIANESFTIRSRSLIKSDGDSVKKQNEISKITEASQVLDNILKRELEIKKQKDKKHLESTSHSEKENKIEDSTENIDEGDDNDFKDDDLKDDDNSEKKENGKDNPDFEDIDLEDTGKETDRQKRDVKSSRNSDLKDINDNEDNEENNDDITVEDFEAYEKEIKKTMGKGSQPSLATEKDDDLADGSPETEESTKTRGMKLKTEKIGKSSRKIKNLKQRELAILEKTIRLRKVLSKAKDPLKTEKITKRIEELNARLENVHKQIAALKSQKRFLKNDVKRQLKTQKKDILKSAMDVEERQNHLIEAKKDLRTKLNRLSRKREIIEAKKKQNEETSVQLLKNNYWAGINETAADRTSGSGSEKLLMRPLRYLKDNEDSPGDSERKLEVEDSGKEETVQEGPTKTEAIPNTIKTEAIPNTIKTETNLNTTETEANLNTTENGNEDIEEGEETIFIIINGFLCFLFIFVIVVLIYSVICKVDGSFDDLAKDMVIQKSDEKSSESKGEISSIFY